MASPLLLLIETEEIMKFEKITLLLMILCSSLFMSACGSDSDDDDGIQIQQEQQEDEGSYHGSFGSLNPKVAPGTHMESNITIAGDTIRVKVEGQDLPPTSTHNQFIYSGNSCPGPDADNNGDGLIDYQELTAHTGDILIPLDDDLSSQDNGVQFPSSNGSGNYTYEESASLEDVVSDLREPDTDPDDDIGKIGPDERLNLGGRVLVIHGVDRGVELPASVVAREGLSTTESLPIACSVIERSNPPDEDQDPSPAPREDSFSTRLNSKLLISGAKCMGENCSQGKWLVVVDNVNNCSPDGACTEIGVPPIEAELRKADIPTPTTLSFYNIIPDEDVSEEKKDILKDHWVRFDLNGEPEVLEKD
jgi:hypothetical protein